MRKLHARSTGLFVVGVLNCGLHTGLQNPVGVVSRSRSCTDFWSRLATTCSIIYLNVVFLRMRNMSRHNIEHVQKYILTTLLANQRSLSSYSQGRS